MGLFSWLFPSPEDRLNKARSWIEQEDWAEARMSLLGLELPEATELLKTCEQALCRMNLDAAVSWADAGDEDRVRHHLEVAENFRGPGLEEDFKQARQALRIARTAREEEKKLAAEEQRKSAESYTVPEWLQDNTPVPEGADEEAAARIALVVESYPSELKASVGSLGSPFAQALLDLEDGRADLSIQGLVTLPDDVPVVRYERARAAYAAGDSNATIKELKAFVKLHGVHVDMGKHHTATFLATCLAEAGRPEDALSLLRKERKKQPMLGAGLYAQLLEATGKLDEAESVLVKLLRTYSKDSGLYAMLGRVRAAVGNRKGAMTTLEAGLEATKCSPGTCGYRPPDVRVIRSLAVLYLEDGVETERGLELAEQAKGLVQQPLWEDVYLDALAARTSGRADAGQLAAALSEHTPPGEAQERLSKFLLTG